MEEVSLGASPFPWCGPMRTDHAKGPANQVCVSVCVPGQSWPNLIGRSVLRSLMDSSSL